MVKCYQCDEVGHYAKDCPIKKKRLKKLSTNKKIEPGDRKMNHQANLVDENTEQLAVTNSESDSGSDGEDRPEEESDIYVAEMHEERDEFQGISELQI